MQYPIWTPSPDRVAQLTLSRFVREVGSNLVGPTCGYNELYKFSIDEPARFWAALWSFAGVIGDIGPTPYLTDGDRMPGARFFPGARLNYAENALANGGDDSDALVFWSEDRAKRRMTWRELNLEVARLQDFLREAGIGTGDRIAAMLPNMPEAVVGVLGAASIGAVWASCSPDFGVQGVLDRFAQIAPKALLVVDGYNYNGKVIDNTDKVVEICSGLPSVTDIIVVSLIGHGAELVERLRQGGSQRVALWSHMIADRTGTRPDFIRLPFEHPLYILFSSGTTGAPKCIVHSAGGVLLKHICELQLHSDIRPRDRLFYFSTLSWMMWNWLVSGLAAGATLLLYDGSPFHPTGNVLWDFAARERCTHFGTSAKYIDALKKSALEPGETHDLSRLRSVLSTGSPLAPESFDYVYRAIRRDVHLASISGGTDICGCFVLGNPMRPVFRGEIQGPSLGLAIDVFDESGQRLPEGKGELVCQNPFPSMPIGFFGDSTGNKYKSAYFSRFPGVWHHGDFAQWTRSGGMIIHGRSDATLNPGGVRIGTAEIYRQVELLPEIRESVAVGQEFDGDVRIVLFVILQPGARLDDELRNRLRAQVRRGASPRHVPSVIVAVPDIPRTRSGKISELAVRDAIMGRAIPNSGALANPESVDLFQNLPELGS